MSITEQLKELTELVFTNQAAFTGNYGYMNYVKVVLENKELIIFKCNDYKSFNCPKKYFSFGSIEKTITLHQAALNCCDLQGLLEEVIDAIKQIIKDAMINKEQNSIVRTWLEKQLSELKK